MVMASTGLIVMKKPIEDTRPICRCGGRLNIVTSILGKYGHCDKCGHEESLENDTYDRAKAIADELKSMGGIENESNR